MAIENNGPESAYQGPAAKTGDTEDGLYPDAQGDLGHKQGGDTEPPPGSSAPQAPDIERAKPAEPKQRTDGDNDLWDNDVDNSDASLDSTIDEE